jgi:hypothetical protein
MFFFGMSQAVLLLFLTGNLGLGPGVIGLIFSAGSIGGLLGAAVAVARADRYEEPPPRQPFSQFPMQLGEWNACSRILRVQIEREPEDFGVELAPCLLGRLLAEPAERSDVVAPDDDRMLCHCC